MKRLPQGVWRDTVLDQKFRVLYYDARSRCYRVEFLQLGRMRRWLPVEEFGDRYQSMGMWGLLLLQRLNLADNQPALTAADGNL